MGRSSSQTPGSRRKKSKKPVSAHLVNNAGVVDVKWNRDVPAGKNLPQSVLDRLEALSLVHSDTRRQLDALRKSRAQREVGSVKVPAHLQQPVPMSDAGVRKSVVAED